MTGRHRHCSFLIKTRSVWVQNTRWYPRLPLIPDVTVQPVWINGCLHMKKCENCSNSGKVPHVTGRGVTATRKNFFCIITGMRPFIWHIKLEIPCSQFGEMVVYTWKSVKIARNRANFARNRPRGYANAKKFLLHHHWNEAFHMAYKAWNSVQPVWRNGCLHMKKCENCSKSGKVSRVTSCGVAVMRKKSSAPSLE